MTPEEAQFRSQILGQISFVLQGTASLSETLYPEKKKLLDALWKLHDEKINVPS